MTEVEAKRVCASLLAWLATHEHPRPTFLNFMAQEMMRLELTPCDVAESGRPLEILRAAASIAETRMGRKLNTQRRAEEITAELNRATSRVGKLWTAVMQHAYDLYEHGEVASRNERPQGVE